MLTKYLTYVCSDVPKSSFGAHENCLGQIFFDVPKSSFFQCGCEIAQCFWSILGTLHNFILPKRRFGNVEKAPEPGGDSGVCDGPPMDLSLMHSVDSIIPDIQQLMRLKA